MGGYYLGTYMSRVLLGVRFDALNGTYWEVA